MTRAVGFAGYSGSGKTTLICRLLSHLAASGHPAAAIKHTHHPVQSSPRGDAGRFLVAGAAAVILAGDSAALLFRPDGTSAPVPWSRTAELIGALAPHSVLIEGYKSEGDWPRIIVNRDGAEVWNPDDARIVASVSGRELRTDVPEFHPDDLAGIAAFVDRIFSS
jgi:molybdopterin-guanine dinucleotide biosynthesis protein B